MSSRFSDKDRENYLQKALKAADWFVNSQLAMNGHKANADRGRFLYYYYMPEKKYVPGINWTHGRALFVLSEAFHITGGKKYLRSAVAGARYIEALQITDPYYSDVLGAVKEHVPQDNYCGVLDGAQAAGGLLMMEKATGREDYLRRGRAFCDFLLRHFTPEKGLPDSIDLEMDPPVLFKDETEWSAIKHCSAIPCWHLYHRTGEEKYLAPVVWAADRLLKCQRPDGAFNLAADISKSKADIRPNHHWGRGEGDDRYVIRNDDGMVTVFLAAYEHTKEARYLDSMIAYADWIVENGPRERPFCTFPIQASNVLDISRMSGKDYSEWVLDNLEEHLLKLQVEGTGDPMADGGFRGEDEEDDTGIFGGTALDYVPTRTTCYAAGTLFRLSGKGTGAGFSVFGLE